MFSSSSARSMLSHPGHSPLQSRWPLEPQSSQLPCSALPPGGTDMVSLGREAPQPVSPRVPPPPTSSGCLPTSDLLWGWPQLGGHSLSGLAWDLIRERKRPCRFIHLVSVRLGAVGQSPVPVCSHACLHTRLMFLEVRPVTFLPAPPPHRPHYAAMPREWGCIFAKLGFMDSEVCGSVEHWAQERQRQEGELDLGWWRRRVGSPEPRRGRVRKGKGLHRTCQKMVTAGPQPGSRCVVRGEPAWGGDWVSEA